MPFEIVTVFQWDLMQQRASFHRSMGVVPGNRKLKLCRRFGIAGTLRIYSRSSFRFDGNSAVFFRFIRLVFSEYPLCVRLNCLLIRVIQPVARASDSSQQHYANREHGGDKSAISVGKFVDLIPR